MSTDPHHDHASNYRNWAENAKVNGKSKAVGLLEGAAGRSLAIYEKFEAVLDRLDGI